MPNNYVKSETCAGVMLFCNRCWYTTIASYYCSISFNFEYRRSHHLVDNQWDTYTYIYLKYRLIIDFLFGASNS